MLNDLRLWCLTGKIFLRFELYYCLIDININDANCVLIFYTLSVKYEVKFSI